MKTKYIYKRLSILISLFLICPVIQSQDNSQIIDLIKTEIDRSYKNLYIENLQRPFYINYTVFDRHAYTFSAENGGLSISTYKHTRNGFPYMLVGSYEMSNATLGEKTYRIGAPHALPHPICSDNGQGTTTVIWKVMDEIYKYIGGDMYESKMVALKNQGRYDEKLGFPDFEKREPIQVFYPVPEEKINKEFWENYVKKTSEAIYTYKDLLHSKVSVIIEQIVAHHYDTEGTKYINPIYSYIIRVDLLARAENGDIVSDELYTEVSSLDRLPDLNTYINSTHQAVKEFLKLLSAPKIKGEYNGPVLVQDMALCEFLYGCFFYPDNGLIAYRTFESHYSPSEGMIGRKVMDNSLSMFSLTGSKEYNGQPLEGYVGIDAQGVIPAEKMVLVENGILKNVLSGRNPTEKTRYSNGHMRFSFPYDVAGADIRITPGNVLVTSKETLTNEQLKQKLIEAAKDEGLDYAYIIKRMRGNNLIIMYKVYVDDGREELVRGGAMPNPDAKSFRRILGVSDKEFRYTMSPMRCLTTLIIPESMLFESLEIVELKNNPFLSPILAPMP